MVVINIVPTDSNISMKSWRSIGLKKKLERMWEVKAKVAPVMIGPLGGGS